MVSVSGVEVKFGRILLLVVLVVGLIFLYKKHGTASHDDVQANDDDESNKDIGSPRLIAQNPGHENSEQSVPLTIKGKKCSLTYLKVSPSVVDSKKPSLLLLHGLKFNAARWKSLKTLDKLKEWNYTAVAVNLAGENCTEDGEGKGALIHEIVRKLGLEKVVLVSPSKSGQYSIPYIMEENYRTEMAAFIPIAPTIDGKYKEDDFKKLSELKVMIVQGSKDTDLAPKALKFLKKMPLANDHVVMLEGAGHACYIDKPEEWHQKLHDFLATLSV